VYHSENIVKILGEKIVKKYSEIMTGKSIVIYSVGKNDNFTSKEFEDRVLEIFARKDYQIDVRR